jgi:hypothetical protein
LATTPICPANRTNATNAKQGRNHCGHHPGRSSEKVSQNQSESQRPQRRIKQQLPECSPQMADGSRDQYEFARSAECDFSITVGPWVSACAVHFTPERYAIIYLLA